MKNEMTLMGIGPRLGLISLPYVILALSVMLIYPDFLRLEFLDTPVLKVIAILWLTAGLLFWIYAAIYFIRHFKPGQLITSGPFAICRNPIYASIILFIIKISIHGEEVVLKKLFGEQYEQYCRKVNVIVPFI